MPAVQSFRIGGGDSIKRMLAADPRSDIKGREMMIGMCMRRGGGFIHVVDVSVQSAIREYDSAASEGPTLLILTGTIRPLFFLSLLHVAIADVVSGCGKNAGGAVETVAFHNLSLK